MSKETKAQSFRGRFLEAGISTYGDDKILLIKSEDLLRIASKFKGAPVIIEHRNLEDEDLEKTILGFISNVFIGEDGWAWCELFTNDKEAIELFENGWLLSCAYLISEDGGSGTYHGIPYDSLVLDIEPDHLAIVAKPRYEDVKIVKNSKSIESMLKNVLNKIKKNVANNEGEMKEDKKEDKKSENESTEKSKVIICKNGDKSSLEHIVEKYRAKKSSEKEEIMNEDDEIEIDGEKMTVAQVLEYLSDEEKEEMAENESDEEDKEDKEKSENESDEDEEEDKKSENESDEEEKEEKKEEKKTENSVKNKTSSFKKIKNSLNKFNKGDSSNAQPVVKNRYISIEEKFERGKKYC